MEIRFEERQGALVVTPLEKRLDALAAPDFRARLTEKAAGRSLVVLDLGLVQFVDSSGLASMISVVKRLAPGGSMRIARPAEPVSSLLRLTRLDRVFPSFPDVAAAIAAP